MFNGEPLNSGAAKQALGLHRSLYQNNSSIKYYSIDIKKIKTTPVERLDIFQKRFDLSGKLLLKILQVMRLALELLLNNSTNYYVVSFNKVTLLPILLLTLFRKSVVVKMTQSNFDDPSAFEKTIFRRYVWGKIVRRVSTWIAITPGMVDPKYKNIKYIPNYVSFPKHELKKSVTPIYLCVGVICERKQNIEVLKFWERNFGKKNTVDAAPKLIFAGSIEDNFSEYNKSYVDSFCSLASSFENVDVLGHLDDLSTLYEHATHYVSFSQIEGLSNALLEAIANELYPVVWDANKNILPPELYQFGHFFENSQKIDLSTINLKNTQKMKKLAKYYFSFSKVSGKYRNLYDL